MHYYSQVILTDGSWHCKPALISDSDREDSHGNPEARDSPVGWHLSNRYSLKANKRWLFCFIDLMSALFASLQIGKQQKTLSPLRQASLWRSSKYTPQHLCWWAGQPRTNCEYYRCNLWAQTCGDVNVRPLSILTPNVFSKVQKEKLHAELKQVLSQKRSLHRDTQSTLTDMEEPPKTENKNEVRINRSHNMNRSQND